MATRHPAGQGEITFIASALNTEKSMTWFHLNRLMETQGLHSTTIYNLPSLNLTTLQIPHPFWSFRVLQEFTFVSYKKQQNFVCVKS